VCQPCSVRPHRGRVVSVSLYLPINYAYPPLIMINRTIARQTAIRRLAFHLFSGVAMLALGVSMAGGDGSCECRAGSGLVRCLIGNPAGRSHTWACQGLMPHAWRCPRVVFLTTSGGIRRWRLNFSLELGRREADRPRPKPPSVCMPAAALRARRLVTALGGAGAL